MIAAWVWFIVALFVAAHASGNGRSGTLWFLITLFTGFLGLVLYAIILATDESPTRICPECNFQNDADVTYCSDCGTEMPTADESDESKNMVQVP